ncbi:Rossmann fold nucleotide-binding protein [Nocardioides sp. CN2-186]|uniref:LOG family protein n=1 Tax=Nocardioides tweenelious TaxID=3156607 RepID=UPI0032B3F202
MNRPGVVRGEPVEAVTQLELWMADEPDVPVDIARTALYTAAELYGHGAYADSLDACAYAWSLQPRTRAATLARALHDHSVDLALESWVEGRRLVGVMGGHRLERGSSGYTDAARLGALLGRDHVVATGGGPGAMEAANLGGRLAGHPEDLGAALQLLAGVPSYHSDTGAWAQRAFEVLDRFPGDRDTLRDSLGIPTWHYGHEPPNVFASAIAKYFRNSTREATLLQVCDAGIVFLPGLAGTVQEVFQDACENYYADESALAPMVLVGRTYWTEELPGWPLLRSLARGTAMEPHVHLVDSVDEAANLLVSGT